MVENEKNLNCDPENIMDMEESNHEKGNKFFSGYPDDENNNQSSTNFQSSFTNGPNNEEPKKEEDKKEEMKVEIIKTGQGIEKFQNESPKESNPGNQEGFSNSLNQKSPEDQKKEDCEKFILYQSKEEDDKEIKEENHLNQNNPIYYEDYPIQGNEDSFPKSLIPLQKWDKYKSYEPLSNDDVLNVDEIIDFESNQSRVEFNDFFEDYEMQIDGPAIYYGGQEDEGFPNASIISTKDNEG